MTIYAFETNTLRALQKTNFAKESILEREHLQNALKKNVAIIAPDCLVIAEEFSYWQDSKRRIDLLALDKDANIVVIELKRTESGEHMELQAIRYAAMVSTLTFGRTVEIFQEFLDKNELAANAEESILSHLAWDEPEEDSFALKTRIILAANDFSKELTTSVMWLNQTGLDITCWRMLPYKNGEQTLIDIQQIIPLPEAADYQVRIRQQSEERREARESTKDYTKYDFDGASYNKRKLVLAVIKKWVKEHPAASLAQVQQVFPQELSSRGLFRPALEAKALAAQQGIQRHFNADEDIFNFPDAGQYVVSNQWGKRNLHAFLAAARALGYSITEIS